MSAESIAADAAGRRLKGRKAHNGRMAAINAERRAIEATGAKAIARCPEHGLHGERNECFVCYAPVELVAMVPAAERDELRAHKDHLRATMSRLLIFARGNDHVLGIIHDALDWRPGEALDATTGREKR